MKHHHVLIAVAGIAMLATAGMAATSNVRSSRRTDFHAPGKHQFYVWCTTGQSGCELPWQGRLRSRS
jgi:hypothetical protein